MKKIIVSFAVGFVLAMGVIGQSSAQSSGSNRPLCQCKNERGEMFDPLDITEDTDRNQYICILVAALPTPKPSQTTFNCFWQPLRRK